MANSLVISAIVTTTLVFAVLAGRWLRPVLKEEQLSGDSKDAVKFAMGLVATMSALLLGLLVSSAKGNYDETRDRVIQMASKVGFLDRLLSLYGPETSGVRHELRGVIADAAGRLWPDDEHVAAELRPNEQAGDAFFKALQALTPQDDGQRTLKAQIMSLAVELGELRTLLQAQAIPSVSMTMLVVVICWLVVIFFTSSMLAPPNAVTAVALIAAGVSVSAALFLILELDQPFNGLLHVSGAPVLAALSRMVP